MLEIVTFTPRVKHPTLVSIWTPFLLFSLILLLICAVVTGGMVVFLILESLLLLVKISNKNLIKITISPEEKTFDCYYSDCWKTESVVTIDILNAQGSYKFVKLGNSEFGWQLIIFNNKKQKITLSQGSFKKFQLDQMVRMINQIKKGIFIADVGTEF